MRSEEDDGVAGTDELHVGVQLCQGQVLGNRDLDEWVGLPVTVETKLASRDLHFH